MKIDLPRLQGDGILLRPLAPEDAHPYAAAFTADPDLGQRLGLEADPDETAARSWIEAAAERVSQGRSLSFAIADPATDAFWGEVLVHALSEQHRRGEIGFWLAPEQRGRGIGVRAIAMVLDWLFDDLDLLRVEMTTTPDNPVVPALAHRLGFKREGVLRARNIERGQRVDLVWFGLLREEWPPSASS